MYYTGRNIYQGSETLEHLRRLFDRYDRILVFDTETTGLDFEKDEIIQFSAVVLEARETIDVSQKYNALIRLAPGRTVPSEITRLTGITDEALQLRGIDRKQACAEIAGLITESTLLAAYNAHFDLSFLFHMMYRHGDFKVLQGKEKLDILTIYRDRQRYPHRLSNAIEIYGLGETVTNSHSADDDALAAAWVLDAMAAELDDIEKYIDLFGYVAKYGAPRRPIRSVTYRPQTFEPGIPIYAQK